LSVSDAAKDEYQVVVPIAIDVAPASIAAVAIAFAFELFCKDCERRTRREFQNDSR
jgi:hypothetical protein